MFGAVRPNSLAARRQLASREEAEDAALGKFGLEFNETEANRAAGGALTIAEARLLLERERAEEKRDEEPGGRDPMTMPVFQKCHEYVTLFSRFRDEDTVRRVRQDLIEHDYRTAQWDDDGRPRIETAEEEEDEKDRLRLTRFEMAQLANLSIEDVEEAVTLIPTLAPKDHAQLEDLLSTLSAKRRFQN
ncbi:hypothetical protein FA09DRAFT_327505 [Tilletiopsis washingtonensis]|uniref:RNA polymerase Rpb4/RPC9 core domain-containing protein n=1 Tax=Tilletiopsis washingtonensis TaxID=58919 RepID=A0A316ZG91_9BASI|nr:hypothetical protein FA09DRAFT_327505 [Tilletiopsis washingtonensis]PWO00778.1 hypothetical protein FA09DRAFT_327505 [Tilletiopsis washingtonensis]